jgi:CubicO group peptidase (beta-lactamase class C family)
MRKFYLGVLLSSMVLAGCEQQKSARINTEIQAIEKSIIPLNREDSEAETFTLAERMEFYKVPGLSIAVVKDGKLHWAKGYGIANSLTQQPVDENTLFQAASISKPLAALAALKLAEDGRLDLDENVNAYIKTWKLPENGLSQRQKPTIKRVLSHTAGISVHGFPGYQQTDSFPSLNNVLNGEGNTPAILVDTEPGSKWRYSGGGYTVLEKLVEDMTQRSFEDFMEDHVLLPLGMTNSTYVQPLPKNLYTKASAAYNREGELLPGMWHNYPEKAAAGLWTTPSDLAKYCIEVHEVLKGKSNGLLKKETVELMLTKHENGWGLGPSLEAEGDSLIFQHGGKNAGFTNDLVSSAYQGNAIIVMTNADNGGKLIREIEKAISDYYGWGLRK